MKRTIAMMLVLMLAGATAQAQDEGFGVGVILGEPTGLTIKSWFDEHSALDFATGWSFEGRTSFHIHGSWLYHDFDLIPVERGALPVYAGIGGRYKYRSGRGDRLGVRVPVGLAYHFEDVPLEAFAEVGPIVDVAPSTSVRLTGGIGLRWYLD